MIKEREKLSKTSSSDSNSNKFNDKIKNRNVNNGFFNHVPELSKHHAKVYFSHDSSNSYENQIGNHITHTSHRNNDDNNKRIKKKSNKTQQYY